MRVYRRGSIAVLLSAIGWIASPVSAQGLEDSEIRGVVRDASPSPIQGASVILTGSGLVGGPRTFSTDDSGAYRFAALAPGTYSVRVEAPGFARAVREDIVLALGTTASVGIELRIAQVIEHVDVAAHGQVVDVHSSAVVTTLDEHLLQSLPTSRVLGETLALAPGVLNPSTSPGLVVAFGGTIGSNALYLDGVDMTEPRRQAVFLPVNYNWTQQVQVMALGVDAEYGEFTGAIGNAVLRSGGNRFSTLAEYWTTDWRWVDRNGSSLAGREILDLWDVTAQAGGPLRRDRVWFFAGTEYYRREDTLLGYHDATRSEETPRTIGKLTAALSPETRIEGHVQRNWSTIDGANAGPGTAPDALDQITQSDTSWNIRLTKPFGARTLLEMRHGGYSSNWREDPLSPRTRNNPSPVIDGVLIRGNSNIYQDHRPVQLDTEARFSRQVSHRVGGAHELEAGFGFKSSSSFTSQGFPGGQRGVLTDGRLSTVLMWAGDWTEARGRRTAIYVQDRWRARDRVTLNLGLRADFNRGSVSTGETVLATNPVSPRAGVVWTLGGSQSAALKVHYGRYYDALLTERVAFMDVPGIGTRVGYQIAPSGEPLEVSRSAPPTARAIDPDIRQSHVDQYFIAIERRVLKQALFQAQFVRRDYADSMAMTDTGSRWTPVELRDPGPDGRAGTSDDGAVFTAFRQVNPGEQFLFYTNPPDAFRRYHALQFVMSKRWADNWQLQASFTFSGTSATVGNSDFTNAGLNDNGDQTGTRLPGVFMSPNGGINAEGRAIYDKNEFKVLGVYRVPLFAGVNAGGVLWRQSGNRWERSITYFNTLVPFNFQTIRLEPRGSRVTDPVWNLDLRIEPTVSAPNGMGHVGVVFDVFNVVNQGTVLTVDPSSGSGFGTPVTRSNPRTLRLAVRWRW